MSDTGYVAIAYLVFLALVLIYLGIMAAKLGRVSRDVVELADALDRRGEDVPDEEPVVQR